MKFSFHFSYREKYYIGGKITNSDTISLDIDKNDPRYVTGFHVMVDSDSESDGKDKAEKLANVFMNELILRTKIPIQYHYDGTVKYEDKKITVSASLSSKYDILNNVDVDLTKTSTLPNTEERSQKLARARVGLEALTKKNFSEAIQKFYQVIENSNLNEKDSYRSLRDAVSHEKINSLTAIKNLRNFGISMNVGESLDLNSPKIQKILEIEANNLKSIIENYLNLR